MKTAGIIGGIGPESTLDYYRRIIAAYRARRPDGGYPHLIINSIDLTRLVDLFTAGRTAEVVTYLLAELDVLARGGADFAVLAANTPHLVFDALSPRSPLPLISIVEATQQAASARGMKRVGLFGTRFTMQGRFYPDVFGRAGIAVVVPSAAEQEIIHDRYMRELVNGIFLPATRDTLVKIAGRLRADERIDGLILGGTELPLILGDVAIDAVPFLDTTGIHVEQVVARLLST
jgi:aspartate racemase